MLDLSFWVLPLFGEKKPYPMLKTIPYFLGKDGMLTAASLRYVNGVPEVAATRNLFQLTIPRFDVSADGKRFLVFKVVDTRVTEYYTRK